jgi:hypothetical protein
MKTARPSTLARGLVVLALVASAAADEVPAGFRRFLPRGRIPSLDEPQFVPAKDARIPPDAWVLGVVIGGEARAYSLNLLNRHEVVNDRFGGRAVCVVWCPLANAGVVYGRRLRDQELRFEPSGVLMNGTIVMQDKETDSFWPLTMGMAAYGELKGTRLEQLPVAEKVQWKDWLRAHPDTLALSEGGAEHIDTNPYEKYTTASTGFKGLTATDPRLATMEPIYAFELGSRTFAVPLATVAGGRALAVGGRSVFLYRPAGAAIYYSTRAYVSPAGFVRKGDAWVESASGARFDPATGAFSGGRGPERFTGFDTFWFTWSLTHPDTEVLRSGR